jgi:hypothetical protein
VIETINTIADDLHRVIRAAGREALDRRDPLAGDGADRGDARPHRLAVEVHRARAALCDAAAELGPGQAEQVAQRPQQRHLRGRVDLDLLVVDGELDHGPSWRPSVRDAPAGGATARRRFATARRNRSAQLTATPAATAATVEDRLSGTAPGDRGSCATA